MAFRIQRQWRLHRLRAVIRQKQAVSPQITVYHTSLGCAQAGRDRLATIAFLLGAKRLRHRIVDLVC